MTDFYKVIYEYITEQKDELSVKEGEVLRITNKENADWWIAERINQSNSFGLVPSNFLEAVQLGIVTKDYEAQGTDELDLTKDDKVIILGRDNDWTKGESNGKTGVFPSNHVKDYSTEKQKPSFKLAAYGVKQGGIGSILAGGIQKKSSPKDSIEEEPKIPPRSTTQETKKELKAMVLHDYSAESEDEITLMRGEYITVLEQPEQTGWWKGANERGKSGVFPFNFVQIIEQPPPRPSRTRPPTVKTEENAPPVPVGTRPSSLLTNRPTSPPSRPLTSPPQSLASPPRSLSVSTKHRRTPSIPVTSPDLPPLSPVHTARPVIPRPTSSIDAAMNNMAKPPKINFTPKLPPTPATPSTNGPVAPPRPASRPPSLPPTRPSSIQDPHPPIPKRSMPPLPPTDDIEKIIQKELDKLRQEFEVKLEQERKRLEELIYSHFK